MSDPELQGFSGVSVLPVLARLRLDLVMLRELLEHIGARQIAGTVELSRRDPPREALVLTLDDGEHLVLLVLSNTLCHWDASREPIEQLRRRMCQWLAESPSKAEQRK